MTRNDEFSISVNSSSALVTPSRSEIRIELPTIKVSVPTRSEVCALLSALWKRTCAPLALLSSFALVANQLALFAISFHFMLILALLCVAGTTGATYYIYKDMVPRGDVRAFLLNPEDEE